MSGIRGAYVSYHDGPTVIVDGYSNVVIGRAYVILDAGNDERRPKLAGPYTNMPLDSLHNVSMSALENHRRRLER